MISINGANLPTREEKISGTLKCLPLGTREVIEVVSDPDEEDVDIQHANVALDAFIDNEDEEDEDDSDSEDEEV